MKALFISFAILLMMSAGANASIFRPIKGHVLKKTSKELWVDTKSAKVRIDLTKLQDGPLRKQLTSYRGGEKVELRLPANAKLTNFEIKKRKER